MSNRATDLPLISCSWAVDTLEIDLNLYSNGQNSVAGLSLADNLFLVPKDRSAVDSEAVPAYTAIARARICNCPIPHDHFERLFRGSIETHAFIWPWQLKAQEVRLQQVQIAFRAISRGLSSRILL